MSLYPRTPPTHLTPSPQRMPTSSTARSYPSTTTFRWTRHRQAPAVGRQPAALPIGLELRWSSVRQDRSSESGQAMVSRQCGNSKRSTHAEFCDTALFNTPDDSNGSFGRLPMSQSEADQQMAALLRANANRPLNLAEVCFYCRSALTSKAAADVQLEQAAPKEEVYPHVYQAAKGIMGGMSYGGRFALPVGTTREDFTVRVGGHPRLSPLTRNLNHSAISTRCTRRVC